MNVTKKVIMAAIGCSTAISALAQFSSGTQYELKNVNSGLAVNVAGGFTTNGAAIIQWPYGGSANSLWTFQSTDSGYYQIVSVNSGKDLVVQGASKSAGAKIIQWSFGSSKNDQWKPGKNSDGSYTFTNRLSGLVLEVPGNSTSQGTQLDQWGHNGGANQKFTVTAASSGGSGDYTAAQVLAGVQKNMVSSKQVNTKPHINTMTRAMNVNVYQVTSGVFAYTSSMAIDDDGSDPDPDPDHQGQTTWTDDNGAYLGAHHVPYYVLGDDCYDGKLPCKWFYYKEHNITGLQFALIFYNGKCIGAVFGDTQGTDVTSTSNNDSRELGEASVESAALLGIPSSGTTGGVTGGVTVVIFSGSSWVVHGTNSTLKDNAQAMIQKALNTLGPQL